MSPDSKLARVLQVSPVKVPMRCHIATRAHVVVETTVCIDGEVGSDPGKWDRYHWRGRQLKIANRAARRRVVLTWRSRNSIGIYGDSVTTRNEYHT